MIKLTSLIIIFIASFAICFLGYWLGGGNFERGHNLAWVYGFSLFISGSSVIFYLVDTEGESK